MALFLDIHAFAGDTTPAAVADAHRADRESRDGFGALCLRSWISEDSRHLFCLVEADDLASARGVHTGAGGLEVEGCFPVSEYA